jgi:hypothetical protein
MPYKSAKQRRYMHAKEPAIAKRWDKKYGGKIVKKKAAKRKKK